MTEQHEQYEAQRDPWDMLTTSEAAYRLRYASPASFRRGWRRAKMPMFRQLASRRWLVKLSDVERFLETPAVDR